MNDQLPIKLSDPDIFITTNETCGDLSGELISWISERLELELMRLNEMMKKNSYFVLNSFDQVTKLNLPLYDQMVLHYLLSHNPDKTTLKMAIKSRSEEQIIYQEKYKSILEKKNIQIPRV